jgi:hypothetical protein
LMAGRGRWLRRGHRLARCLRRFARWRHVLRARQLGRKLLGLRSHQARLREHQARQPSQSKSLSAQKKSNAHFPSFYHDRSSVRNSGAPPNRRERRGPARHSESQ